MDFYRGFSVFPERALLQAGGQTLPRQGGDGSSSCHVRVVDFFEKFLPQPIHPEFPSSFRDGHGRQGPSHLRSRRAASAARYRSFFDCNAGRSVLLHQEDESRLGDTGHGDGSRGRGADGNRYGENLHHCLRNRRGVRGDRRRFHDVLPGGFPRGGRAFQPDLLRGRRARRLRKHPGGAHRRRSHRPDGVHRAILAEVGSLLSLPAGHAPVPESVNPYGDGAAAVRAVAGITAFLGVGDPLPDFVSHTPARPWPLTKSA